MEGTQRLPINCFEQRLTDGVDKALFSKIFTGPIDIYEVQRFQRHLLAAIENN